MKKIHALGLIVFLLAITSLYAITFHKNKQVKLKTYQSVLPEDEIDPYYNIKTPMGFSLKCAREPYKPICGETEVQCIKAPCPPVQETFPNKCSAIERGATVLSDKPCPQDLETEEDLENKNPAVPEEEKIPLNTIYKSEEAIVCMRLKFHCEENYFPFSDETGCGCKKTPETKPLETEKEPSIENEETILNEI